MAEMIRERLTSAQFYALSETNQLEELIDGELIVSPPPLDKHQLVFMRTLAVLIRLVNADELRGAPTGVHFDDGFDFEPDIFWISPDNDHCVLSPDGRYWHGAPDLIVEILSPSTAHRDRGIKYETYEKHGVREYWLIDPEARFIEVYRLEGGRFARVGLFSKGQSFTSVVLNNALIPVDQIVT